MQHDSPRPDDLGVPAPHPKLHIHRDTAPSHKFLKITLPGMVLSIVTILLILNQLHKPQTSTSVTIEATPAWTPQVFRPITFSDIMPKPSPTPEPTPAPIVPKPLEESKTLPGDYHVFQSFNNCGPASLSMALYHLGFNVGQQELGQQLRPYQIISGNNDDKSVTFAELASRAQDYNLLAYHRPAGNIDTIIQFINNDIPVLTRTWLNTQEDIGHYRLVKGFDQTKKVLIQDDSLQGANLSFSYDDFLELWRIFNYEFLVLVPKEKQQVAEAILGSLKDPDQAWQIAQNLANLELSHDPSSIYARFNRSVANYHLGNYQQAIKDYEAISAQLPFRTLWYQIEPILAYYQVGDYEKVLAITQNIIDNHNRAYSELYYIRHLVFTKQNQPDLAQAELAKAYTYNTKNGPWLANLATIIE